MRLYLLQHGEALSKEQDPERPLSPQGEAAVRRLAEFARNAGLPIARVVHSGKLRAAQSAQLLAAGMPGKLQPELHPGLKPNDPPAPLVEAIGQWNEDTAVVSHLPLLARLAAGLLGLREEPAWLGFVPGTLLCLERDDAGDWSLAWMLRPELLA